MSRSEATRPVSVTRLADIVLAAQLACLLEASAPKPGNVSPGRRFGDMGYEDFLVSALALADALRHAHESPIGATVRRAIDATARWTRVNTNLGIVLLLTPLVRAAARCPEPGEPAYDSALRAEVKAVLAQTTVDDAREVYVAIRKAGPGGLGRAEEQDVAHEPDASLLEVMALAADRDDIAREYATSFATTFDVGVPAVVAARHEGLSWDDAVVETFLTVLAARPDTHIARRAGGSAAQQVSAQARDVVTAGGVRTAAGRRRLEELDGVLREQGSLLNPGTTADLTAAALFVMLASGGWSGPATR